jgi:hypothetical protein
MLFLFLLLFSFLISCFAGLLLFSGRQFFFFSLAAPADWVDGSEDAGFGRCWTEMLRREDNAGGFEVESTTAAQGRGTDRRG